MVRSESLPCIPSRSAAFGLLVVVALASLAGSACGRPSKPTVVLISLDGTRPADVRDERLTALTAVRERGVVATRLVPVFPTNTFPNHVTLVTGVAPDRHGIVNNIFFDPVLGFFEKASNPDWIEVEPLWSLAAQHGILSASFHWVGSEGVWRRRGGPEYWRAFDSSIGEQEKVEQILEWLELPRRKRPRLVTAWFHGGDRAGHLHGPGSPEVARDLAEQDRALGRLLEGLERRDGLADTTLILVSDHGMVDVEQRVDLRSGLRSASLRARVRGGGGFATVHTDDGNEAAVVAVARALGLEAHRREEAPAALRVGHPRFGDVVVIPPIGVAIVGSRLVGARLHGVHGYRPDEPGMEGLFMAVGRGVAPGARLGEVRAVDVAPTVLALLGVAVPEWMEGRPIPGLAAPESGQSDAVAGSEG